MVLEGDMILTCNDLRSMFGSLDAGCFFEPL